MGSGARGKVRRRALRATFKSVVWLVAAVVVGGGVLLKTGLGHRAVLEWALDRVRRRVAGELEVDGIRSASLWRSARLSGVRLVTPEGEPLLSVDSLEASYGLRGLLAGRLEFRHVRLWGPRLLLGRLPGQESSTLARWLGQGRAGGAGGGPDLRLDDVRLESGSFTLLTPIGPADTAGVFRWEEAADGPVRRLDFTDVSGRLTSLTVEAGGRVRTEIGDLSAQARVFADPLDITGVEARVDRSDTAIAIDLAAASIAGADARGRVTWATPDSGGPSVDIDVSLEGADLARFGTLTGGLPPVVADAQLRGRFDATQKSLAFTNIDGHLDGGRVEGAGVVELVRGVRLRDVALRLTSFPLQALTRRGAGHPAADGKLTGAVRMAGPLDALATSGRLSYGTESYADLVAEFDGSVRRKPDGGLALSGFTATAETLDWSLLSTLVPGLHLAGFGRGKLAATGDLADGLRFTADLEQISTDGAFSRVLASGSVRSSDSTLVLDIQADLSPLSFAALREGYPSSPFASEVRGAVRARGRLEDLEIRGDLGTELGSMNLDGRLDLRTPGAAYRLTGTFTDVPASRLLPALPDPSRATGRIEVEGTGLDPVSARAEGRLALAASRLGGLHVDTLLVEARLRDGILAVDTLAGQVGGVTLAGAGALTVDTLQSANELQVRFASESLLGLRPLLMGDTVIAGDTLTALERDLLALSGVDPDTLPDLEDVVVTGTAQGQVTLTGFVTDFTAVGHAELEGVRVGRSRVGALRADILAGGLPRARGRIRLDLESDSIDTLDRSFTGGRVRLDFTRPSGTASVELHRSASEDYVARGRFELGEAGGSANVDLVALQFDSLRYELTEPASFTWTDSAVTVDRFEMVRKGPDPARVAIQGRLPLRGPADFRLDAERVDLDRLVHMLQIEGLDLRGMLGLRVQVAGTAADPRITGSFEMRDLHFETVDLSRLDGTWAYGERDADVSMEAWRGARRVLELGGHVPLDLAFRSVPDRTPDLPMDIRMRADSMPAVFVLAMLQDLEDVRGTVTGEVRVQGTVNDLAPAGVVDLVDGAWTVGALGVRQDGVTGSFTVRPDRSVDVRAHGDSGGGTVDVGGVVTLSPLRDPELDLTLRFARFRAVDRRDVTGTISGDLQLLERYRRPRVEGRLQVDEGVLFLEEFQRSVEVVDLSDPRFFAYVDTTSLRGRPLLARTGNPFMDNLRVFVDLGVERNTWLRSDEMNVEMGGDLLVTYDRRQRDLVMVGELQAIRGQYSFYNRTFDVGSGTVEFVGTPGLNPNLNIQASTRVRRRGGEPLDISATLSGTLVEPRVTLSSDETAVAESDLVSYLVFGRASSEVNTLGVQGRQGVAGLAGGALVGTLATSLGSLVQGNSLFDYLSISQAAEANLAGAGVASSFASTQIEVGRYFLGGDYFAALVLRPLHELGTTGNLLGGFRVEWQASDQYHLEAFAEDRFLRTGGFSFREIGIRSSLIYGLAVFREWGY